MFLTFISFKAGLWNLGSSSKLQITVWDPTLPGIAYMWKDSFADNTYSFKIRCNKWWNRYLGGKRSQRQA